MYVLLKMDAKVEYGKDFKLNLPSRNHSPFVIKSEISPPSSDFNTKSSCKTRIQTQMTFVVWVCVWVCVFFFDSIKFVVCDTIFRRGWGAKHWNRPNTRKKAAARRKFETNKTKKRREKAFYFIVKIYLSNWNVNLNT